jgi:hypothetical protein
MGLATFVAAVAVTFFASAQSVPDILRDHRNEPAWVAEEAAVAPDGELREDVLGPFTTRVRDKARLNGDAEQCRLFSTEHP